MGCDIHAFIQVREFPNTGWHTYATDISIRRDYLLFLVLASVRSHSFDLPFPDGIFPARGLPADVADRLAANLKERETIGRAERDMQMLVRWEGDGHTYSWLTYEELVLATRSYRDYQATLHRANTDLQAILGYMAAYGGSGNHVRLVFWFDN